jgi:N-acetylmuramate 1-kinase
LSGDSDSRLAALKSLITAVSVYKMEGDASVRAYYRTRHADGSTKVAMVMPEANRDEAAFLEIRGFLDDLDLPVPKIYGHFPDLGIVLIEDLGDELLENFVSNGDESRVRELYFRAVDILLEIIVKTRGLSSGCRAFDLAFDEVKLSEELQFFVKHFIGGLCRMEPPASALRILNEFFGALVNLIAAEPRVFAHRDYHSRNLIVNADRIVMIDFQDARMGPAQYDLASLLRDSYVDLPESHVHELLEHYMDGFSAGGALDRDRFRYVFDMTSLQRNIKALGTFGYQATVRKSAKYMSAIPRTARYVKANLGKYPELRKFQSVVEDYIIAPALEIKT